MKLKNNESGGHDANTGNRLSKMIAFEEEDVLDNILPHFFEAKFFPLFQIEDNSPRTFPHYISPEDNGKNIVNSILFYDFSLMFRKRDINLGILK